jgi:hypothetical protein
MVTERADDGDTGALVEDGAEGEDVRQVLAATIGVAGDHDVAVLPVGERNEVVDDAPQRIAHRVEMLRDMHGLRDVEAVAVVDRARVAQRLAYDGRT